jgi:hypothetical protein
VQSRALPVSLAQVQSRALPVSLAQVQSRALPMPAMPASRAGQRICDAKAGAFPYKF